jgi:hypothetical protein
MGHDSICKIRDAPYRQCDCDCESGRLRGLYWIEIEGRTWTYPVLAKSWFSPFFSTIC